MISLEYKFKIKYSKDFREEFDNFLSEYQKTNSKIFIDIELIDALSVIVELDVISIELVNDVIILPIPYDTNFKSEIEIIHREIKEKRF